MRYVQAGMVLFALMLGVAGALTINVDGYGEPAWDGWLLGTDPDEADIPQDYDIEDFFTTDNMLYMYFRVDVYGIPTLDPPFTCYYQVHLDLDMNPATGRPINGVGAEYILDYRKLPDGTPVVTLYDENMNPVSGADVGAAQQNIPDPGTTELKVALADLGIGPGHTLNILAFLNNGQVYPDDKTVTYTTIIPEPITLALFGIGLAGFGIIRRKR